MEIFDSKLNENRFFSIGTQPSMGIIWQLFPSINLNGRVRFVNRYSKRVF